MVKFNPVENGKFFPSEGWTKSFRSGGDKTQPQCMEWYITPDLVGLRDSNHKNGPVLALDHKGWAAFQDAVVERTLRR